jgi:predicted phosphoribosyltransferase
MGRLYSISRSSEPFATRREAARLLADHLKQYSRTNVAVLGIPRGGIIIAAEIARILDADLDIIITHKLGAPHNPELAIGAVSEDGKLFLDKSILAFVGADDSYIEAEKNLQQALIAERLGRYRQILPRLEFSDRIVIVTDDGVATGATMLTALWAVRAENPAKLIAALPVGPDDTLRHLAEEADETICLRVPPYFGALGRFYLDFTQVEDGEIIEILKQQAQRRCTT